MERMQEKYDDTVHNFFYSVGFLTTTGLALYFWNNVYPITVSKLVTDVAWQTAKAGVKCYKIYKNIKSVIMPYYETISTPQEEKPIFIYYNGKLVENCTLEQAKEYLGDNGTDNESNDESNDESNKSEKVKYDFISVVHKNTEAKNDIQFFTSIDDIDTPTVKSDVHYIGATLKRENKDDLEITLFDDVNVNIIGNALFTPKYLQWCGIDLKKNSDNTFENYSVSVIDNSVNIVEIVHNEKLHQHIRVTKDGYKVEVSFKVDEPKKNALVQDENVVVQHYMDWLGNIMKSSN